MSFRYVADSYAWIAYFNKKKFKEIIENEIIETPSIAIAEIVRALNRKKIDEKMIEKIVQFILERGFVLNLDFECAKRGGELAEKEGLSLVDGIIYSYIQNKNDRLLTGDEHFRNKNNVIFEKE